MAAKILTFPSVKKSSAQPSVGAEIVALHGRAVQMTHADGFFPQMIASLKAWAKARAVRREQQWEMRYWTPEVYADHHMQAPVMWRESHQTFWK